MATTMTAFRFNSTSTSRRRRRVRDVEREEEDRRNMGTSASCRNSNHSHDGDVEGGLSVDSKPQRSTNRSPFFSPDKTVQHPVLVVSPTSPSSAASFSSLDDSIESTRTMISIVMLAGLFFWSLYGSTILFPTSASLSKTDRLMTLSTALQQNLTLPMLFVGTAVLFAIHCVLSVRYDSLVRFRHDLLCLESERSHQIVHEIFPATVRDRLFERHEQLHHVHVGSSSSSDIVGSNKQRRRRSTGDLPFEQRSMVPSPLALAVNGDYRQPPPSMKNRQGSTADMAPIVDSYPMATVLFADVVGFTSWSSNRDPVQVFTLLEHLFAAFDHAASCHNIFKVETIGDSYMAVAGAPEHNDNHAIDMCWFAKSMLLAMNKVLSDETLLQYVGGGTDVKELNLRIGLNSGPVTAGVLRGQKARFQLFGDTVNTASRMESLSLPGQIQVSESTAAIILRGGATGTETGSWLTPRTDPIHAKGKGSLCTYWLQTSAMIEQEVGCAGDEQVSSFYYPEYRQGMSAAAAMLPSASGGESPVAEAIIGNPNNS